MKKKVALGFLVLLLGYVSYGVFRPLPQYQTPPITVEKTFETFYQQQLAISQQKKVRPGNEEKLVRYVAGQSEFAFLYIHGFGASRAEGEYSIDRLSREIKANTYYVRLPGHGTNIEDHKETPFQEYLATAEKALAHTPLLGKKIILVGTSMGGLIATWLASKYPEKIYALILASPFYDYQDPKAIILSWPGGVYLGELIIGKYRIKASQRSPNRKEGYENYWYVPQYMRAVFNLQELKRFASRKEVFSKVKVPVLLLAYPQDKSASFEAMREAFGIFQTPAEKKLFVEIARGDHVLLSEWVDTDKELIHKTLLNFMKQLR